MENNLQEQVIDFIKKSKIQANRRLPNERELSTKLNTTRGKIRNVLLIMENHGLLFRKHGSGTYLSEKFVHHVEKIDARVFERKDQINGFLHSIETRMLMEPSVCQKAAEKINEKQQNELMKKVNSIFKSKYWINFKKNIYDFFLTIYTIADNEEVLHVFAELYHEREKLNFDGRGTQTLVSSIVRHNTHLELNKLSQLIVQKKPVEAKKFSEQYLNKIFLSLSA
tara:strand:+ start:2127 stop:2801 length:675 start_codon:yes stop_codon:yes gene_type:complete